MTCCPVVTEEAAHTVDPLAHGVLMHVHRTRGLYTERPESRNTVAVFTRAVPWVRSYSMTGPMKS